MYAPKPYKTRQYTHLLQVLGNGHMASYLGIKWWRNCNKRVLVRDNPTRPSL